MCSNCVQRCRASMSLQYIQSWSAGKHMFCINIVLDELKNIQISSTAVVGGSAHVQNATCMRGWNRRLTLLPVWKACEVEVLKVVVSGWRPLT